MSLKNKARKSRKDRCNVRPSGRSLSKKQASDKNKSTKMAGQPEHAEVRSLKTNDIMMTPPRKLRQLKSPPKINQSRPVYLVRVGPKLSMFDDWSDEEPEDAQPVKPWSQSA